MLFRKNTILVFLLSVNIRSKSHVAYLLFNYYLNSIYIYIYIY
jgi:hypothetical protein